MFGIVKRWAKNAVHLDSAVYLKGLEWSNGALKTQ